MITVLRFIIFIIFIIGFIYVVRTVLSAVISYMRIRSGQSPISKAVPFTKSELCPACNESIRVSKTEENLTCPKCGAKLGRSKEGKLLIRLN